MKRIEVAALLGIIITLLLSGFSGFEKQCDGIRESVFRLHVIANSDNTADQALKLKVRDNVLEKCGDVIYSGGSVDSAKKDISLNLESIEAAANEVIAQSGFSYTARATIENKYFNTRTYDDVSLPAGYYDCLCLRLGKAEGKNWWCVVYPPMCLPAACEEEELSKVLTDDELRIVTDAGSYKIKFKLVEIFQKLRKNRLA